MDGSKSELFHMLVIFIDLKIGVRNAISECQFKALHVFALKTSILFIGHCNKQYELLLRFIRLLIFT